jgi:hypothetical protein
VVVAQVEDQLGGKVLCEKAGKRGKREGSM